MTGGIWMFYTLCNNPFNHWPTSSIVRRAIYYHTSRLMALWSNVSRWGATIVNSNVHSLILLKNLITVINFSLSSWFESMIGFLL